MAKSSKKRARTVDDDVVDPPDGKPVVKKSKLDSNGEAEVTKKSTKVKEPKNESAAAGKPPKSKKEKKEKKDKTEKKSKSKPVEPAPEVDEEPALAPSDSQLANGEVAATADASSADKQTSAKKKKKDKKKKQAQTSPTESQPQPDAPIEEEPTTTSATNGDSTSGKPARFIVFVGNLPFSATADAVRAHFASLHPTSVRLLTQRDDPTKSRGIAFVEFGRYDHMRTCLEKFHHSEFDDGTGAPRRRINVELTAGGGGKTAKRRDKIKQKNAKLNEERARRLKKEEEAKREKAAQAAKTQEQRDRGAIHPSRRAQVPYGRQQQ